MPPMSSTLKALSVAGPYQHITVMVTADQELDDAVVETAIEEAGYELVGRAETSTS
jgi:hypothetical protein